MLIFQNNIRVTEVSLKWKSLNSGDVFVLDLGLHLIQVDLNKSYAWCAITI